MYDYSMNENENPTESLATYVVRVAELTWSGELYSHTVGPFELEREAELEAERQLRQGADTAVVERWSR
jgi:hypothetical protein